MLTRKTLKLMGYKAQWSWNEESFAEIIVAHGTGHPATDVLMQAADADSYGLWAFGEADDFIGVLERLGDEESLYLAEFIDNTKAEYVVLDFRDSDTEHLLTKTQLFSIDASKSEYADDIELIVRTNSPLFEGTSIGYITSTGGQALGGAIPNIRKYASAGEAVAQELMSIWDAIPDKGLLAFDF